MYIPEVITMCYEVLEAPESVITIQIIGINLVILMTPITSNYF